MTKLASGCAPLLAGLSRRGRPNRGEAGHGPANPRSGVGRCGAGRRGLALPPPRCARPRGMAGLRGSRFRQGRADPGGPPHRRPRPARRPRRQRRSRCSTRTTPTTAPPSIRRAACCSRPRTSSPICMSPGQADARSTRPRPISRDASAARDRAQEDLRRNAQLLKSGVGDAADRRPGGGRPRARPRRRSPPPTAALATAQAPMGRPSEIEAQSVDGRGARGGAGAGASGGSPSARSRLRSPASSPTCMALSRRDARRPARRSSRCCRRRTSSSVSSCPSRSWPRCIVGDTVALTCDNCPRRSRAASVSFISPQAEYTPPFIYSESTRAKFVFLAEARPTPDAGDAASTPASR